jgi:hypothetical protein
MHEGEEGTMPGHTKNRLAVAGVAGGAMLLSSAANVAGRPPTTFEVSGSGVDLATEAIVHSEQATPTGVVKRLTEIVRLDGDLNGYVLYQPIQVFDFAANTLVVTGTNTFSGTIAGSDPVTLRSDEARFEVDLASGAETGSVRLTRSNDAPEPASWFECDLVVVGTGQTSEGNPTFDYRGVCTRHGRSGQARAGRPRHGTRTAQ